VPCSADSDEQWCRVCSALIVERQTSAAWQQMRQTSVVLATATDDTSGGIQKYSLNLVGGGLGCPASMTLQ